MLWVTLVALNHKLAMKEDNGSSLAKFCDSYAESQQYKGIQIVQNDRDLDKFIKMKRQFFQSLYDNFEQRFPSDDFLQAASCLNPLMWPKDPLKSALHGDKSVA